MGSGRSGLYSGAVPRGLVAGSIDYMTPGDPFSEGIKKRRDVDAKGFFDLIAHGSPKTMLIEHNGTQVEISHRALARLLENDSRLAGKPIRLLSCNTGKIPKGFAQGLADRLGVKVKAPTKYLWTDANGNYFVADGKKVNGKLVPVLSKPGIFETYNPHKRRKKK